MKKTIALVLVLALGLAAKVAKADFTFGEPTNLGPAINSAGGDAAPSISADGLEFYFHRWPGGVGELWVARRENPDSEWGSPSKLGPNVNSPNFDGRPCISANGLLLYFFSNRPGGFGMADLWVTIRATVNDNWGTPVNLGATVNSAYGEIHPSISTYGLELYFQSDRPGGHGNFDIWVSTRATTSDPWGTPMNLGPTINTSAHDEWPGISPDGLLLFFSSNRSGGFGSWDLYMARRTTREDPWGPPMNLGPMVNSASLEAGTTISTDGSMIYFQSTRSGGLGGSDIWQLPISPIVDFNNDGIVDAADVCIMVEHWLTDYPLCDIGPMPWGDGVVDVQDLIVIAEYLSPVGPEEVNVNEADDGGQIELEQGQILVVTLESNPTTGYQWEQAEDQEPILEQMGEAEFIPSDEGEPPMAGAGGWEIFRFKAISAGKMTLQLVYHRTWEEGVEPVNTFSLDVVIH